MQLYHSKFLKKLLVYYPRLIEDDLWCDFEKELGNLIIPEELTSSFEAPYYASEEYRDNDLQYNRITVELELFPVSKSLKEIFLAWIKQADSDPCEPFYKLDSDSVFFSFNYTHTLERIYGIQDQHILHIHNKIGNEIIYGHDYSTDKWEKTNLPEYYEVMNQQNVPNEYISDIDFSIRDGYEALGTFYTKSGKHPEANIANHESFWKKISTVDEIVVLGTSLANGDEKYIRHIASCVNLDKVKWILYFHKENQEQELKQKVIQAGVPEPHLTTYCSKTLQKGAHI